ncbi:DUF6283 family protein [Arthrobacter sp. A2-55]|uniref:DUF6283 family protein n=1 Tax=Arthrobacter sp. A2-55 TaxID=2897337 RepID=UPI0021CD88CD|nr:DUF6283 family protein [Arthrobacter sp. A2-55]MCU6480512.1 DUF6283 family protein [Arthrobacter sp. A2-55]
MNQADQQPAQPRKNPCASCPYREGVPSGVWEASEYEKLWRYDGETFEQDSVAVFMCHQHDGCVCSGWLGHRDPLDLLAVRLGLMDGRLDGSCAEYSTDVPLFGTGQEAAAHGVKDLQDPSLEAQKVIGKIIRKSA